MNPVPKISKNASVTLSLVCCGIGFLGLVGAAALLAYLWLHGDRYMFGEGTAAPLMAIRYFLLLIPVGVADGFLVKLLLLVKQHLVFTDKAVSCLRTISWCCFIEAVLCLVTARPFFPVHYAAAFAAAFLGLVLRVVKNVIEEAVALKAENDFTI